MKAQQGCWALSLKVPSKHFLMCLHKSARTKKSERASSKKMKRVRALQSITVQRIQIPAVHLAKKRSRLMAILKRNLLLLRQSQSNRSHSNLKIKMLTTTASQSSKSNRKRKRSYYPRLYAWFTRLSLLESQKK